jgi:hypothetical protein
VPIKVGEDTIGAREWFQRLPLRGRRKYPNDHSAQGLTTLSTAHGPTRFTAAVAPTAAHGRA